MMDDNLKIKVLMIYYAHWGKEELQARKTVDGVNKTVSLLMERFPFEDHTTLYNRLQLIFHYLLYDHSFQNIHVIWTDFVYLFLPSPHYDSLLDHDYYGSEEGRNHARKNRLCDSLHLKKENVIHYVYNELGTQDVISVDAIVALR